MANPNTRQWEQEAEEALRLQTEGLSRLEIAARLGLSLDSVKRRLSRGRKQDPAIQASMDAIGTGVVPSLAWVKTPAKDGEPGYSVLLKPQELPDETLDRIRDAFEGMKPAHEVPAPERTHENELTAYLIADAHIGLMAWGKETGEAYDTGLAAKRMRDWVGRCVYSAPPSHTALILDVGDGQHADDQTNQTPKSKHALDTDTRHFRTLDVSIEALGAAVDLARAKHQQVIVRIIPGNHNPTSYMTVLFALHERYRNDPRVTVEKSPSEFFVMEWGKVMLAAHHGDKAKADRLVHFVADEFAEMWGRTKHRYLFTGHLHHHKSQDIGGMTWEQLRAMTSRDAYAYSHAYSARAQMQAITYDKERGEIQRVKVGS